MYYVEDVVCDSGVWFKKFDGSVELVLVVNSRSKALQVAELLNADIEESRC